ncbi:hypothetical protein PFISCL1PPCAC_15075 [Pristionchus fissidentatus]|uniref:Conserved oligomeric Golgi complex subunit 2 n=1 Tax=Pristionchus fissidentatus TaxID=1538716 RepID=A0AAV5VWJ1_9BILA|nr:hypothetical protein PFISCL1PPCAC_15075 [Pristionchus fissidentatus]
MTITSPKMFAPSGVEIDVSQLCFNKAHFTRSDFDVQRFMTLARRRSDLKTIHSDLRLYLKSIQHSMVELINEDYAHFVNLSSNLVGLKTSIDSINTSIDTVWKDFNETAKDAVTQAEKIEQRCTQLTMTRDGQERLSRQVTAISAMKKVRSTLKESPTPFDVLSLEQLSSLLSDLIVNEESIDDDSVAKRAYSRVIESVGDRLNSEFLSSLQSDLSLLPLLFSLLSLCRLSDRLVSRIVSDIIDPSIKRENHKTPLHALNVVLQSINEVRSDWSSKLGVHSKGPLMDFLDQSLLTFLLSYIDKSLSTHLTTSPSLFHSAFQSISQFITEWPSPRSSSSHLKAIRSRFQLQVYFLQVASSPWKKLQELADPSKFSMAEGEQEDEESRLNSHFYLQAINTIKALWSEDRFLLPLTGKCWEQTTKIIMLCVNYAKRLMDPSSSSSSSSSSSWSILSSLQVDCTRVGQLVFDHALIAIWPRLREVGVDTSTFGQTLNAFTAAMENEAERVKKSMVELLARELESTMDGVSQLPKQYRWTKKPAPTTVSPYITSVVFRVEEAMKEAKEKGMEGSEEMGREAIEKSAQGLIVKAQQVLETVNATGVSLSRLKRREGAAGIGEGETDEEKIRMQMGLDLNEILERVRGNEVMAKEMEELLMKIQSTARQPSA